MPEGAVRLLGEEATEFVIVFAAFGASHDDARFFQESFEESGVLNKVVMFLNLADEPVIERLLTPRAALTAAEYLPVTSTTMFPAVSIPISPNSTNGQGVSRTGVVRSR